ncbi:MAG: sensor histidine kinase [Steroidobacter sp.]
MNLTQLKNNREAMFWSLHAIGWGGYATVHYLGSLLHDKPPEYIANYLKVILAASIAGFLISAPLRYICRVLWFGPPAMIIGGGLLAAYITALAWRLSVNLAYVGFMPDSDMEMTRITHYFGGAISAMYIMTCWVGLYFGFRYYESMQLQREAVLRSSALAQEAQLKMLRYQLNPHFLFNTLNAISTLILDNRNSTANSAVTGLSEFLRYTLDQDPMKKVTVAQEVEALNLYLNIEKMRFGERLSIGFFIDDAASTVLMPSLLLQPLIENAIKYAVSPRERGGVIRIAAHVTGGMLQLEVADDGPGMIDATRLVNGRGVGVRNTRERLQVLYSERGNVAVTNTEPGLRVALTFPAERALAAA